MHGAAAGQVQRKAAERVAQAKALAVYQRCSRNGDGPVDVLAELEHLVGVVTHFADFAESRLAALGEDDWRLDNPAHDQTIAEVRTFERAQQAAAQLLTEVVRLDLYGRQVAQAKQIAAYVSEVIESVFVEAGFSWRSDGIPRLRRVTYAGWPSGKTAPRERDRLHTLPSWPRSRWRSRAAKCLGRRAGSARDNTDILAYDVKR